MIVIVELKPDDRYQNTGFQNTYKYSDETWGVVYRRDAIDVVQENRYTKFRLEMEVENQFFPFTQFGTPKMLVICGNEAKLISDRNIITIPPMYQTGGTYKPTSGKHTCKDGVTRKVYADGKGKRAVKCKVGDHFVYKKI